MYLANPTWAIAQEKLLRAFAANPEDKRLRFKPMKPNQRAFIHSLSQDFGFDSESMDPEPHRHVALFKTPRFVMAPMKTIADCVRIKQMQQLIANPGATSTATAVAESTKKPKVNNLVGDPLNAFLITRVQFGLTIEDIRKAISSVPTSMHFAIDFLLTEEILLRPTATVFADRALEIELAALKPAMAKALSTDGFGSVQLCRVDESLNVERRETDGAAGGWSQVAAKAAAPRRAPVREPFGVKSSFVVLGRLQSGKEKKKTIEKKVVEDWEEAEAEEEEKEKAEASGGQSEGDEEGIKQS
jgi:transcriptional repressor NF-X1